MEDRSTSHAPLTTFYNAVVKLYLMKWDIVKSDSIDSNVLSKVHGFASHFFGRNIHVST